MTMPANRPIPDPETIRNVLEQVAQHGVVGSGPASILDVGTREFVAYFEREIIDDLIARGGATCRFFVGSYGSGKTHLLCLLSELASDRSMATVQIDLGQDLGLDDWFPITKYILQHLQIRLGSSPFRGLPSILDGLRETGRANVGALKRAQLPHPGFHVAMLRAVTDQTIPEALCRYLAGDKIGVRQLQQFGISGVKDPLSRRNALLVLCTVVGGIFHLGVPGTLLLFDENEKTLASSRSMPSYKLKIAANLMRRLIDGCTTEGLIGTGVIFAVLPEFLIICTRQYPALGQRIETEWRDGHQIPWRWPVVRINAINTLHDRQEFLEQVVARLGQLAAHCRGDLNGLEDQLRAEGLEVLREHVGDDYRRWLLKRLATIALNRLEEGW